MSTIKEKVFINLKGNKGMGTWVELERRKGMGDDEIIVN